MKKFGLIGHPLEHSKSPKLHQILASKLQRKLTYELFDVSYIKEIGALVGALKLGKYDGFNITIPYKEAIRPFLDEQTPKALKVGSVNTVFMKDGKVIGDNTDYDGFKYLFDHMLLIHKPKGIIILGSGGAAKACYAVCTDLGYRPWVVSRRPHVSKIFDQMISYEDLNKIDFDLIIQTTPIGMYPHIERTPLDKIDVKGKYVIDLIYNPETTKLLKEAKFGIGGIDMLIIQALNAQNIWFESENLLDDHVINQIRKELYE